MNPPPTQAPMQIAQPLIPGQPTGQPTGQPVQESEAWIITTQITLGPNPIPMNCPHCGTEILTRTENNMSAMAWIIGLVLCALG